MRFVQSILESANYHVTTFAWIWLVLGSCLLILSSVIFFRQRISIVGVLFASLVACAAVWFLFFGSMFSSRSHEAALFFARLGLIGVSLIPAVMYHFAVTTLRTRDAHRRWLRVIWIGSIVGAVLFVGTDLLISGVSHRGWGFYPVAGRVLVPYLVLYVSALATVVRLFLVEFDRATTFWRKRGLRDLIITFIIADLSVIDFLPMYVEHFRPVGYAPIILFSLFGWTAIRRHRLGTVTVARASGEIIETMTDALFVVDAEARIRVINGAVTRLLGFTSHDILGRSIDTLEHIETDQTISRALSNIVDRGAVRDQVRLLRTKQGDKVDVSISISPVRRGALSQGAVVIARDIRERRRAEERLHSFAARLQQSNRELEDFAYVASHDLQEPLRKIQAFGDRLRSREAATMTPEGIDYLTRMQSAAGRMQTLINDLLAFSRVTTKARPFVPVDLGEIASEVLHDLEVRIHERSAVVNVGTLPILDADPLQMRQLLQNLISNALKFSREGVTPVVDVAGHLDGAHGEDVRCVVDVRDNGIGFDEKYAERIFTIFERLHGRGSYEGTGIGLAICRKICERHGGSISAASTPGVGSTFTFVIPVRHSPEENDDAT